MLSKSCSQFGLGSFMPLGQPKQFRDVAGCGHKSKWNKHYIPSCTNNTPKFKLNPFIYDEPRTLNWGENHIKQTRNDYRSDNESQQG